MSSLKISAFFTEISKGISYLLVFLTLSTILNWLGISSLMVRYLIILASFLMVTTLLRYLKKLFVAVRRSRGSGGG